MKKSISFILFSCLVLFGYSCSSDDLATPQSEELHEVTFNISNFSSEVSDMSTLRATLVGAKVKYLHYTVVNTDLPKDNIIQSKTLEGTAITSSLKLKLKKGNYKISFFGSEKPISTTLIKSVGGMYLGEPPLIETVAIDEYNNPNKYHAVVDVIIGDADIQKSVELKRPLGKITLAISDLSKAPSSVQTIIPILTLSDSNLPIGDAIVEYTPGMIAMNTGATLFEGLIGKDPYPSIYLNKTKFSAITEANPFSFYVPQNVQVDTQAVPPLFGAGRYDLYLQGVKTNGKEQQNIMAWEHPEWYNDPSSLDYNPNAINPNIVFYVCIKRGIVIKPNEQIIIKGKLFKDSQLSVVVNNTWDSTNNESF